MNSLAKIMFSEYGTGKWKPFAQNPEFYDELLNALEEEGDGVKDESQLEDHGENDKSKYEGHTTQIKTPPHSQEKDKNSPPLNEPPGPVIDLKKKSEAQRIDPRKKKIIAVTLVCHPSLCFPN